MVPPESGDHENKQNLKAFLGNLTQASGQAAKTLEEAQETIEQAYAAIGDYRTLADTGTNALDRVVTSVVTLSEELTRASSQVNVMVTGINNGQGTMGKFVNDARFYEELVDTSEQLQVLATEMKTLIQAINDRGLGKVWKKGAN